MLSLYSIIRRVDLIRHEAKKAQNLHTKNTFNLPHSLTLWCFIDLFCWNYSSHLPPNHQGDQRSGTATDNNPLERIDISILLSTEVHFHRDSVGYRVNKPMSICLYPHVCQIQYMALLISIYPETEGKHLVKQVEKCNLRMQPKEWNLNKCLKSQIN